MGYTYTTFVNAMQIEAVQLGSDVNWTGILPTIIQDSEQRCYRDLQLISTIVRDQSAALTANSRNFILPQSLGMFVVVKSINFFTAFPAGRRQMTPSSIDWLDAVWPSETALSTPSLPQYYAPLTDQQFIIGPAPDSNYRVEVIGNIRPAALSATNTTTYLTNVLPDLFFAGAMCSAAAYMRSYGSQSDDPKLAMSWEQQYTQRLGSAKLEEAQRKFASGDWTSEPITPIAQTQR